MKNRAICVLILFLLIGLGACGGNQSAVEGKLVDWNGKPAAGRVRVPVDFSLS